MSLPSSGPGAPPHTLWGISPLAPLHLGLDKLIVHQQWLIAAGAEHTIVLADVHATLCAGPMPHLNEQRTRCYEHYLLQECGLNATLVRGSAFQHSPTYQQQLGRLLASADVPPGRATRADARATAAAMQILDPVFLGVDAVLVEAGDYRAGDTPISIITPTLYDTHGRPLRESTPRTRITVHDDHATLTRKIKHMYAPPPEHTSAEDGRVNALLEHFRWSVFPWTAEAVPIHLAAGGYAFFHSYEDLRQAYNAGRITPGDAKTALLIMLSARLQMIQVNLRLALRDFS
ncbi:hypothetical protein C1J01_16310 [Nonomuraea aridisoli]|uniref:tyrosine--tRNA ligase n=2 Tax=Nonomuraea aridisoli TaxID=2070368 RepID=A0A2W2E6M9_9ACTN|nr:hypothetical protein C1J01_16310 [Nonomuraea aridisoli]